MGYWKAIQFLLHAAINDLGVSNYLYLVIGSHKERMPMNGVALMGATRWGSAQHRRLQRLAAKLKFFTFHVAQVGPIFGHATSDPSQVMGVGVDGGKLGYGAEQCGQFDETLSGLRGLVDGLIERGDAGEPRGGSGDGGVGMRHGEIPFRGLCIRHPESKRGGRNRAGWTTGKRNRRSSRCPTRPTQRTAPCNGHKKAACAAMSAFSIPGVQARSRD